MSVKDIDNTADFLERFDSISRKTIRVGIQGKEAEAYHTDKNGKRTARMIVIAGANEYGCNTGTTIIPERSFIRGTFDKHKDLIEEESQREITRIIEEGISVEAAYEGLGERFEGLTKTFLTELTTPPNAPATIAAKGSSNPLIDTGGLRKAITHKVGDIDE